MFSPIPHRHTVDRSTPRRRRYLGVLAACGLMVAACSDSSDTIEDAVDQVPEVAEDVGIDTDETVAEDLADGVDTDELDAQTAAVAETLRDNGLTTLATAVEQVDIEQLVGDEEFTLFAPNDEAFLGLTADDTADLLADPAQLEEILRNHVVEERIDATQLAEMGSVTTAGGETLSIVVDGDDVTVGRANVVATDIEAGSGVVHAIDQVLLP